MEIDVCPRWVLAKVGISAAAQPHLAIFLSSWVALLASPVLIRLPHVCLFRTLLGISCPGCGMLHAMAALLKMDIASAWNLNPAALHPRWVFGVPTSRKTHRSGFRTNKVVGRQDFALWQSRGVRNFIFRMDLSLISRRTSWRPSRALNVISSSRKLDIQHG